MASYTAPRPRTILGSLTTTFTPPSYCFTPFVACPSCTFGFMLQSCASSHTIDDSACWPPTSAGLPTTEPPLNGWGFYSPGIHCPAGHTPACSATYSGLSGWDMQFQMTEGETAIGCCMTGFTCGARGAQSCISTASAQTLTAIRCHDLNDNYTNILTASNPINIYAPMIQINYRAVDLSSAASGSETTLNPVTETGATIPSATATSVNSADGLSSGSGKSGISTGAAVGIAVAATAVVVGGAVAAFLLWRRRQRWKRQGGLSEGAADWTNEGGGGGVGGEAKVGYTMAPTEAMDSPVTAEMQHTPMPMELPTEYHNGMAKVERTP